MIKTYLFSIETNYQNFTLINSSLLGNLEPYLRSFHIKYYGYICNFPNLIYNRTVLSEISVSSVNSNTVHSSFYHFSYCFLRSAGGSNGTRNLGFLQCNTSVLLTSFANLGTPSLRSSEIIF